MNATRVGSAHQVSALLNTLLATDVTARELRQPATANEPQFIAVYTNNDGAAVGACSCSLPLAMYVGAALSMIPPRFAIENAEQGVTSNEIVSNLYEVFNVCVNLAKSLGAGRLTLREVIAPGETITAEVQAVLDSETDRLDFEINVDKYGTGVMSLQRLS